MLKQHQLLLIFYPWLKTKDQVAQAEEVVLIFLVLPCPAPNPVIKNSLQIAELYEYAFLLFLFVKKKKCLFVWVLLW